MLLTRKPVCRLLQRACQVGFSTQAASPHVAIVGSGPAGFYTAQQVLKGNTSVCVDIYDKLPVPYGLVRFGVAPDHPEVKNVINTFAKTASSDRLKFFGNVTVGEDVSIDELQKAYTAVVLAYGADDDRTLGIPGEELPGVMAARAFVGWYNGLPENAQLQPDLNTDTVVVLGQGNVAIDVARILLTPVDILRKTDITEYALQSLLESRVERVYLVGRRGPLQVAFTTAELREMIRLQGCCPRLVKQDFTGLDDMIKKIPQKRRRLTQLLMKTALEDPTSEDAVRWGAAKKDWHLKFLRSPIEFLPANNGNVGSVRFAVNKLEGVDPERQRAVSTETTEVLSCGLVLRSIGYKSIPIDGVPFDKSQAIIPNNMGRVEGSKRLYCSGWVKRGPVGVIVSTMNDAFETGKIIVDDLLNGRLEPTSQHSGNTVITEILKARGVDVVSYEDWRKIDESEIKAGETYNKPREKITSISDMISVAKHGL